MFLQCIFIRNNMNGRELGQIANELHFTWSGPKEKMQQNIDCFCIILCVEYTVCGVEEKGLYFIIKYRKKVVESTISCFVLLKVLKVTFPSYLYSLI